MSVAGEEHNPLLGASAPHTYWSTTNAVEAMPGVQTPLGWRLWARCVEMGLRESLPVARTTDPSWASVMFLVSALVVDISGMLSHPAVVARELGVPCVMDTRMGKCCAPATGAVSTVRPERSRPWNAHR